MLWSVWLFSHSNLAPHGVYTWNCRCEFPNQIPAYQILNFTSWKQQMLGVRDNDPVSISSHLLSFGSICFSSQFCKFHLFKFWICWCFCTWLALSWAVCSISSSLLSVLSIHSSPWTFSLCLSGACFSIPPLHIDSKVFGYCCSACKRCSMSGIEVSLIQVFVNKSQSIGLFELVDTQYHTKGVGVNGWSHEL